jgi:hypothetical protein
VLHLFTRLKRVPAVREERGSFLFDEEHPSAAREATEIVDIGKMGYEIGIGMHA